MALSIISLTILEHLSLPHPTPAPTGSIQTAGSGALHGLTTNPQWDWVDITWVEPWPEFCRDAILQQFGHLLSLQPLQPSHAELRIPDVYLQLPSETHVGTFFHLTTILRVNRALQIIHERPQSPHLAISSGTKQGANARVVRRHSVTSNKHP